MKKLIALFAVVFSLNAQPLEVEPVLSRLETQGGGITFDITNPGASIGIRQIALEVVNFEASSEFSDPELLLEDGTRRQFITILTPEKNTVACRWVWSLIKGESYLRLRTGETERIKIIPFSPASGTYRVMVHVKSSGKDVSVGPISVKVNKQ